MKRILTRYFSSWWLPAFAYSLFLGGFVNTALLRAPLSFVAIVLFFIAVIAFFGLIAATVWNLIKKRWAKGIINALLVLGCGAVTAYTVAFLMFVSMFGPIEDGFADDLTIPEGIEISEPDQGEDRAMNIGIVKKGTDELQAMVRKALVTPGSDVTEFAPEMPSLRRASTDHAETFRAYLEASPDWHVFVKQGRHFAARRWSYEGKPRDTLHGYISEGLGLGGDAGFQTRTLICLDSKPWGGHPVQHVQEGQTPVKPEMSRGNNLHESRVMIESGGVWVEIFEQSGKPERRVTKATMLALEKEFSTFLTDPESTLARARAKSRELATLLADEGGPLFRLVTGMQPGMYGVVYSLNPGEPGSVYLKAFEVTRGTPLSSDRLKAASEIRMAWSAEPAERYGAKAGFTIYEGDWGHPYAARFEVWFKPDSGDAERKLAQRIFKIEGWQR